MAKEKTFSGVKLIMVSAGYTRKIGSSENFGSYQFPAHLEAEVSVDMSKVGWEKQLQAVADVLFATSFRQVMRDIRRTSRKDKELAITLDKLKDRLS